ncbi:YcaO-like family protein [Nitratireductor sp. XY-223]|uniref:YcaO-like family protein n=1 Tax=Nitratireductor sp. XY-223 TaxID=2561926 RepID=UPI0010AA82E8|nr:YcaO-like family protein [Nitratireductor sp. XY-223]
MYPFSAAGALLDRIAAGDHRHGPIRSDADVDPGPARDLLLDLGYVRADGGSGQLGSTAGDPETKANRCALLSLAAGLDDVFELPLPYAPGVRFFGAMVSPERYGIRDTNGNVGMAGRGLDRRRAFESCIGEAAEYLSFCEREDDPLIVPPPSAHGLTQAELDWALSGLGAPGDLRPGDVQWVEARSLPDGEGALFPCEIVLRRPEALRRGRRAAESTGISAGATLDEAALSALLEVVERDALVLWWYGGNAARRIDTNGKNHPQFTALAEKVRGDQPRRWWLLELTSDLQIPVVAALSSDAEGRGIVAGFKAHPSLATAMAGAFLEMCQMELAHEISLARMRSRGRGALSDKDQKWIERFERLAVSAFPELEGGIGSASSGEAAEGSTLEAVLSTLTNRGYRSYRVDLTRPKLEIPVVRVLVPGLQASNREWVSPRLAAALKANDRDPGELENRPSLI